MGVLPVSVNSCTINMAILSLFKDEIKKKFADKYNKVKCPQIALIMGENNVKALSINLGIMEKGDLKFGIGILPGCKK